MRTIDADALLEAIADQLAHYENEILNNLDDGMKWEDARSRKNQCERIMDIVHAQLTIEPGRHTGYWQYVPDESLHIHAWACSQCGEMTASGKGLLRPAFKYCPMCGAKMEQDMREKFRRFVYELLSDDDDDSRAKMIIDAADEYAESMRPKWISVAKNPPENGYWLWLATSGEIQKDFCWDGHWENAEKYGYDIVSYMPLPERPAHIGKAVNR